MTDNEAKVILESEYKFHGECSIFGEALIIAIKALEKQIPKKPPVVNRPSIFVKVPVCPNCSTSEHYQPLYGKTKYCSNCGQKLDWSDSN